MAHYHGDVSVFTVEGNNLLCVARDVTYSATSETVDGSCLTNLTSTPQEVKASATLSFSNLSTISNTIRVSHLDVTGWTVGGSSFLAQLRSCSINSSFTIEQTAGVGQRWLTQQVVKRGMEVQATFDVVNDGAAQTISNLFHQGAYADRNLTFSTVINGVTITFPVRLTGLELGVVTDGLQTFSATFQGMGQDNGTFVTAPTSGTSLLHLALLNPTDDLAVTFTPKAADSFALTGNFVFSSASLTFNDGELVTEQYELVSNGAVTNTNN